MNKKYDYNDLFFNKLSLTTCYWAGFIAADGNVYSKRNRLRLKLARKDHNHLEKFKDEINFTGKVYEYSHAGFPYSLLELNGSKQIIKDLYDNFSITDNKSLTLKPPNLKDVEVEFIYAYMAGYIDGDGCVYLHKGRKEAHTYVGFSVLGTKELLTWMRDRVYKDLESYRHQIAQIRQRNNIHTWALTGTPAKSFLQKLYNIDVPRLERKWVHLN